MAQVKQSHFYDEQIRRYILQFIRLFSGFSVKTGKKMKDGTTDYFIRVPASYGDISRIAATIMKGNSENIVNSAPLLVVGYKVYNQIEQEYKNRSLTML